MITRDGKLIERTPCKTESRTTFNDTPHGKEKVIVKVPVGKGK